MESLLRRPHQFKAEGSRSGQMVIHFQSNQNMVESKARETHLDHSRETSQPLIIDHETVKLDPNWIVLSISPSKSSSHRSWFLEAQLMNKSINAMDVFPVNVIRGFVFRIEYGVKITANHPRDLTLTRIAF